MSHADRVIEPRAELRNYHDRKHVVFKRMHDDQLCYRALMGG